MNCLVLHVKKVYYDAMCDGKKNYEYREQKPYWEKRLQNREYRSIKIYCGYTKKHISRKWKGFFKTTITHKHFGPNHVNVYAIDIRESESL